LALLEIRWWTKAKDPAWWDVEVMWPVWVEENVFDIRSCRALQTLPLVDGNKDGGFHDA
jgi:hypothetical protein